MNKSRKTSNLYNIITYDDNGNVVLPASLSLGSAPASDDNSLKVGTTSWIRTYISSLSLATSSSVTTEIANLIDSAPSTLNTLNELAAALGDDANFSTTVTTSIASKVPQTRTITINGTAYDLSADRSWSIAAGVTSFNTRTGAITLTSGDVTGALGYTPSNDTLVVKLAGAQTITGAKTFQAAPKIDTDLLLKNVVGSPDTASGYTSIRGISGTANSVAYKGITVIDSAMWGASLRFGTDASYDFTFPSTSGTLALTSNLSSYLPLSGGTLTGTVSSNSDIRTDGGTLQVGAGSSNYYTRISTAYNYPYVDSYLDSMAGSSYDGRLTFRIQRNNGAVSPMMTILPTGYVGIGTTSPEMKLDVRGNMLLKGDATDGGILTITRRYSTGAQTINFNNNHPSSNLDWTGARITSSDSGNYNGYLDFAVSLGNNGSESAGTAAVASIMRLNKFGNVLIGTLTDSGYKLTVAGDARISGTVFSGGNFEMSGAWSNSPFSNSNWLRASSNAGIFLVNYGITAHVGLKTDGSFSASGGGSFGGAVSATNFAGNWNGRGHGDFEGDFGQTLNLSGLDSNTYYPVTIDLPTNRVAKLSIRVALNSNQPSWSTHGAGFSVKFIWYANGNGWGTNETIRYIESWNARFYSGMNPIGGLRQMGNSSQEVIWLRGGANYYAFDNMGLSWNVRSSSYTIYGDTVSPTSSAYNNPWYTSTGAVSFGTIFSNYDMESLTGGIKTNSGNGYHISFRPTGDVTFNIGVSSGNRGINGPFINSTKNGTSDTTVVPMFFNCESFHVFCNYDQKMRIEATYGDMHLRGYIYQGNTSWSDIRMKQNLKLITDPLTKVSQLNGYTFEWREWTGYRNTPEIMERINDAGLIAQEVEAVLPEIVENDTRRDQKSMNYNGIIALHTEAIKELIKQNEALITRIQELENK